MNGCSESQNNHMSYHPRSVNDRVEKKEVSMYECREKKLKTAKQDETRSLEYRKTPMDHSRTRHGISVVGSYHMTPGKTSALHPWLMGKAADRVGCFCWGELWAMHVGRGVTLAEFACKIDAVKAYLFALLFLLAFQRARVAGVM